MFGYLPQMNPVAIKEAANTSDEVLPPTHLTDLTQAYKGSYYTITGTGGDLTEWIDSYEERLEEAGIVSARDWFTFTGEQMNEFYHLRGDRAYPSDLVFLAFAHENEPNIGKLAMFKLTNGDRWFDDIVDNNEHGENI